VARIGLGIEAVEPGDADGAVDGGGAFTAGAGAAEEMVLAAKGDSA
jgi:hypothetical protein